MSPTDKRALSPAERPRYRETPDVSATICRLIRAVGRRTADSDPEDLAELVRIADMLGEAFTVAVAGLRETGRTDGEVGKVLGVTKQAVQQQWPRDGAS